MNFVKREKFIWLALLIFATLFYFPIILNSKILLERGNDLQEFFWPVFYFVKQQILAGEFPLWNNLFFSGTPLLPDPQAPLFYLPNIIFLFFPLGAAFVASFFFHTLLGGLGTYLATRLGFSFSKGASLFASLLYVATPRLAGYFEAGHFGLVASTAWLPFTILAVSKMVKTQKLRWSLLLAISFAGLFYTHLPTFALGTLSAGILFLVLVFEKGNTRKDLSKSLARIALTTIFLFGLTAVALLPQLEWRDYTTRVWLKDHDIYPKWSSIIEFFQAIFWPWNRAWELDTEKWLALGSVTSILALVGFWQLKKSLKFLLIAALIPVILISLNNASPLSSFFVSQSWYAFLRVSTRVWFIPTLITIFLAGFGLEVLIKMKPLQASFIRRKIRLSLSITLALLALIELLVLSWLRLGKPASQQNFAPTEVYEFLENDTERFRVFCTTRCLSQKEAAEKGLELVEGYSTLQQVNYFKHSWQLMGGYWNYYTLALPPIGAYKFEELQPDTFSLGEFNTKYVISPYELADENFVLERQFGEYAVYQNNLFQERAYFWTNEQKPGDEARIISFSPNKIRVDTSLNQTTRLVLAEVWSPGWKAYLDGKEEVPVQEKPDALRLVDIRPNTKFVDFVYEPDSFKIGRIITLATVGVLAGVGIRAWKRRYPT